MVDIPLTFEIGSLISTCLSEVGLVDRDGYASWFHRDFRLWLQFLDRASPGDIDEEFHQSKWQSILTVGTEIELHGE